VTIRWTERRRPRPWSLLLVLDLLAQGRIRGRSGARAPEHLAEARFMVSRRAFLSAQRDHKPCECRSAGFQTCCVADFQVGSARSSDGLRIWKSATQQTWKSALRWLRPRRVTRARFMESCELQDRTSIGAMNSLSEVGRVTPCAPSFDRQESVVAVVGAQRTARALPFGSSKGDCLIASWRKTPPFRRRNL
jgi:hypothetical protein